MDVHPNCVLCNQVVETHNHLFFYCCISRIIWAEGLRKNLLSRSPGDWHFELAWVVQNCTGKGFKSTLYKLSLAATLYHIWLERNARIFRQQASTVGDLLTAIVAGVRSRVCSWDKSPNSSENLALCNNWNIPSFVLSRDRIRLSC